MDALVKATIESLVKKVLPQLQKRLADSLRHPQQQPDDALCDLITECRELMDLTLTWSRGQPATSASEESGGELSEEEAMRLLAADPEVIVKTPSVRNHKSSSIHRNRAEEDPNLLVLHDAGDEEELSQDEARALLQEMDAPTSGSSQTADDDELSDEEAATLLREMEAPLARKPAASATHSQAPAAASGIIDDDEAARLLAEMDEAPVPPPQAPEIAPSPVANAPTHSEEDGGEIQEWEPNDFQSDPSMLNDFITNADELMQSLDESILRLEQDPGNKGIIEEIFRAAHTLKGGAGMFGFKGIERVMHRMENLFDLIRKEKLSPNSDTIDTVFQGLDVLRVLLQAVKDGKPCGAPTGPVVRALGLAAKGRPVPKKTGAASSGGMSNAPTGAVTEARDPKLAESPDAAKKKEQSTIRVDLERLDVLVNLVGELVIDRTRFSSIEEDLRTNHPQIKLGSNFSEIVQLFGRHMNEIQDIIMKVRMVPIGNAFNKFTRVVRDIARSLDKKIDLVISGEQAELDKTLVEQIGDPLIHLIRNSCDHGIELPEVRIQKDKDPTGKVSLSAYQEGNQIVIKIEDDGKGIDPTVIRKKAIEKGLISEEEQLSERDILNLIFEPGFSTAEQVTNLSGRGVGMDVVKKQIQKLKGMIELESKPGRGTSTTIRLPLTLAIVQSLLVRSRGETFAIPLATVIESIRISPKDIQRIGEVEVYRLRETVLPLVHLDEAMQLSSQEGSVSDLLHQRHNQKRPRGRNDRIFIVVVGQPDRPTGIVVDQLLNQQEMVIKSMGPLMRNIPCVAGGAVLGHGEVVLVLDIPELEAISRGRGRGQAA
jgi:two-component system chemotaxis sensor kinase CheA